MDGTHTCHFHMLPMMPMALFFFLFFSFTSFNPLYLPFSLIFSFLVSSCNPFVASPLLSLSLGWVHIPLSLWFFSHPHCPFVSLSRLTLVHNFGHGSQFWVANLGILGHRPRGGLGCGCGVWICVYQCGWGVSQN